MAENKTDDIQLFKQQKTVYQSGALVRAAGLDDVFHALQRQPRLAPRLIRHHNHNRIAPLDRCADIRARADVATKRLEMLVIQHPRVEIRVLPVRIRDVIKHPRCMPSLHRQSH